MPDREEESQENNGERIRENIRERLRDVLQNASQSYPSVRRQAENEITKESKGGIVSQIIGDAKHHAGSIAFISVIGLLLILGVAVLGMLFAESESTNFVENIKDITQSLMTLIGSVLGYLFGQSQKE